jgi:cytoskeletal protein CcmA (bactofilin family)
MLSSFKGKGPEGNGTGNAAPAAGLANILAAAGPSAPPRLPTEPGMPTPPRPMARPPAEPAPAKAEAGSSIGAGMSIVGRVVCTGQARIFGRVEGEVRVSDLLLGAGSQVEGNVMAQEVTVRGHVKGTIRAVKVRLEDGATVEGDIFHRSLAIEEGALFEGSSKRVDNPTEAPVSIPEVIPEHHEPIMPAALAPAALVTDPPGVDQLFR